MTTILVVDDKNVKDRLSKDQQATEGIHHVGDFLFQSGPPSWSQVCDGHCSLPRAKDHAVLLPTASMRNSCFQISWGCQRMCCFESAGRAGTHTLTRSEIDKVPRLEKVEDISQFALCPPQHLQYPKR